MQNINYLIFLIISTILLTVLAVVIKSKSKKQSQITTVFILLLVFMLIWTLSLIAQILFQNTNVDPVLFEGFASFGACFLPLAFMALGIVFSKTKIHMRKSYLLLLIIPILSTILMFTNEKHHLFFREYSYVSSAIIPGPYYLVNAIYSYGCIIIGLTYLLRYSIKTSAFFSKQSLLILIGTAFPLIANILTTLDFFNLTVYTTPISFTIAIFFFTIAIFKFDFLKVAPIALEKIVDRMSDGYIIINDENYITDYNKTFLELFSLNREEIRGIKVELLFENLSSSKTVDKNLLEKISSAKNSDKTFNIEKTFLRYNKCFNIEISSIKNNSNYLGTLILFKDITQHKEDMKTIKNNQDILIERERLASLGQMIGGIAHNLKTPIMSISGASEGLSDLIDEYSSSIGDPEVTKEDHLEIAKDMREWINKIQTHLSYMSDVITTVKGQAVTFSENTSYTNFTISDLIRQINILMKHELSHALLELQEDIQIDKNTAVNGNINSLVQVINNIISNAIQAYDGKTGEKIILSIYKKGTHKLIISVKDFAGGLPDSVKNKLFKEMITTKGKAGTGLGLFMSYSNIKAHFNGDITFDTVKNEGTTFYIQIPI